MTKSNQISSEIMKEKHLVELMENVFFVFFQTESEKKNIYKSDTE